MRLAPLLLLVACSRTTPLPVPSETSDATPPAELTGTAPAPVPLSVDPVDVPGDRPAYVLRGVRRDAHPIVFLGGICAHPQGYLQSFASAAADHGVAIGVQGEAACGNGGLTSWKYDLERTNQRIDAAVAAAGLPPLEGAIVIGYSQGAERAERLAAQWPKKYGSLVLIASPTDPKPRGKAVFMAGDFDISKQRMSEAARRMGKRGLYLRLPGAHHGAMGTTPNESMAAALDFLDPREAAVD